MLEKMLALIGCVVLVTWVVCVLHNVWTNGQYRIPVEVTSVLMAIVTGCFSVPFISYISRRDK